MEMSLEIPFDTERTAEIAYHSLRVDPEPKRSGSGKELTLNGKLLLVQFKCEEARTLRVSVGSFLDLLTLVIDTMDQFDVEQN